MDQTFYAGLDLNECAVISDDDNFTFNLVTNLDVRIESFPRMRSKLFDTEGDALLDIVEVKDNDVDLLVE